MEKRDIIDFEKNDKKGRVMNIVLRDLTGQTQITFWHEAIDKISEYAEGSVIKMTDLRVGENKFNDLQLSYNSYSTINKIDRPELVSIKVQSGGTISSLSELTDGLKNIIVQGKVIEISELRKFEKNGEERKVQNISIMDSSASTKVTFWGDDTNHISKLSLNQVIEITNCRSRLNSYSNEIELNITSNSRINQLTEFDESKFAASKESISLSDIMETKRGVNVKGLISKKFDVRDVNLSDGREAKVLNLNIQDNSGITAKVAFWDDTISKADDLFENDVIMLQNVRVKPGSEEYGPEISINKNTIISKLDSSEMGPIIQTADTLTFGYEEKALNILSPDSRVKVKGTIVNIFPPTIYMGCSKEGCARKVVTDHGENQGECAKHGTTMATPKLIINAQLDDTTSTMSLKFFNKNAEKLINMSAGEAQEKIERLSDPRSVTEHLIMKDIWVEGKVGENVETKEQFINVNNFDYLTLVDETSDMLDDIEKYDNTF